MKRIIYIFLLPLALSVLGSCEEWQYDYEGVEVDGTAEVYFSSSVSSSIDLSSSDTYFSIEVLRLDTSSSLTVGIEAIQEEGSAFTVPSSVTFSAGSSSTELVITFDPDDLEAGVYEEITLTITDETTSYGLSEYVFEVGIPKDWLTFGTGTWCEDFVSGYETQTTIYYYEEDNVYHCMVYGTDGSDDGETSYGGALGMGQDFEFNIYYDYLYNGYPIVEVPLQYTGWDYNEASWDMVEDASNAVEPIYVGDYFYHYYNIYIVYYGYTTDTYPQFADFLTFFNYYNGSGYYTPGYFNTDTGTIETNAQWYVYYDTEGTPYGGWLGNDYYLWCQLDGYPDYSVEVTYEGQYADTEGNFSGVIADVTSMGSDVESVRLAVVAGSEPSDSDIEDITNGSISYAEVSATGQVFVPWTSDESGQYCIVAVSYGSSKAMSSTSVSFFYAPNQSSWEEVGTGTYYYNQFFGGSDSGLSLYQSGSLCKIPQWGEGTDFYFWYNESTDDILVYEQEIGMNYVEEYYDEDGELVTDDYGPIYVVDYSTYTGYADYGYYYSYYGNGYYYICVVYYVEEGYLGYGYEYFVIDSDSDESGASVSAMSVSKPSVRTDFSFGHPQKASHIVPPSREIPSIQK